MYVLRFRAVSINDNGFVAPNSWEHSDVMVGAVATALWRANSDNNGHPGRLERGAVIHSTGNTSQHKRIGGEKRETTDT